jgi:hypothetical protein
MASQTVLIVGGIAIMGIGAAQLLSHDLARKSLYSRAIGSWRPMRSQKLETIGIMMIRFVLGPALLIAGIMLVAKGLGNLA